jgi:inward rectifier potassium channel
LRSKKIKSLPVKKRGNKFIELGDILFDWNDIYHFLLTINWWQFITLITSTYFIVNFIFTCAYLFQENAIANAHSGSLIDAFAFSVQTMATIGYGAMYPQTTYAHLLVSVEVLMGLLLIAMATSLMFARFSRPTAKMIFSNVAVICPYNNVPTLMFRVANLRNNWVAEAQVKVSILFPEETTSEGHTMRPLYDLALVRNESPFLTLAWVIMHPINEKSPLFGLNRDVFLKNDYRLFISLTGLDNTVSQVIHSPHVYLSEDILWNHRFVDIVKVRANGSYYIEDHKFHDVISCEP